MGDYNAKNYTEQGGGVTHIGGKLVIDEGGEVEGLPAGGAPYTLPVASADALGGVKAKAKDTEAVEVAIDGGGKLYVPAYQIPKAAHQGALEAEDGASIKAAFNSLLAALQDAGLMSGE